MTVSSLNIIDIIIQQSMIEHDLMHALTKAQ